MAEPIFERATELLGAQLGDKLVALDQRGGHCFAFNPVAASVWRLLEQPRTAAELEEMLLQEYDVEPAQCEAELNALLADLVNRHLIRSRAGER